MSIFPIPTTPYQKPQSPQQKSLSVYHDSIVAVADEVVFTFDFDQSIKYLKSVAVSNNARAFCPVQVRVRISDNRWIRIAKGQTTPQFQTIVDSYYNWEGNMPFKTGVEVRVYGNVATDSLGCTIIVEETP